jgi:CHAT domain-containing protein
MVYAPILDAVDGVHRLVIVPNKTLSAVPFAALRHPLTARYLIEDHELVVVPSAAAYLQSLRRDRALRGRRATVLLASYLEGDDRRRLPSLPAGRSEVASIAALYRGAARIDGRETTPENFLAASRDADVVHVVAHGVSTVEHPEYASIVFAPGASGRDLYAADVAAASLPRTRVLYLDVCGTTNGGTFNDEPMTLPESFLSAGIPVVIGTMRAVEDARAAEFALAFHRAFSESGDAVGALRQTQLAWLKSASRSHPDLWSSWIAFGGSS